ncbi:C-terminal binding protein [Paenibacillus nasutitermitis]|uniref:Dehydrogenase n=1 Tax=Paenibacillus nasutitermitis TaxID=1652958 RepID=A0A916ZBQ3_9BACL|nr:C-terminal binding protein [Paenibacillus nasutitermitis]GGD86100.1 dehydrogenase [Paenibacillus nasutitermitis]
MSGSTLTVAVTDYGFPNLDQEEAILQPLGFAFLKGQCKTPGEVAALCGEADAILTQWAPLTAEAIYALKRCRIIVRYGIGVDNVDLEAAAAKNIPVVNIPDYAIQEVADHTLALMLGAVRKIPRVVEQVRAGEWQIAPCRPIMGLAGKTIGTAGFGNIARAVIRRAQAFGLKAIAYDPYAPEELFRELGVEQVDFETLLHTSDILSLHLPLTNETRGIMSLASFGKMKPSAFLVNTSRGGIIATEDLVEALQKGMIAGAALDVLEKEPIDPAHPLLQLEQCLITSHCAWYSEDSLLRLQEYAALEIKRLFNGESPLHIVNGVKDAP